MPSSVIAARNEAALIGQCLDALLPGSPLGQLDVTVVSTGCTDDTARIAADRTGVGVIDPPAPGKDGVLQVSRSSPPISTRQGYEKKGSIL
jgi:hypothetical protein